MQTTTTSRTSPTARPWRRTSDTAPPRTLAWVPAATAAAMIVTAITWRHHPALLAPILAFTLAGGVFTAVDVDVHRIPTPLVRVTLAVLAVLIAAAAVIAHQPMLLIRSLVCAAGLGGAWWLIALSTQSVGMGDVRLAVIVGLITGTVSWTAPITATFAAVMTGAIGAAIVLLRHGGRRQPFAPYLILGALLTLWVASMT